MAWNPPIHLTIDAFEVALLVRVKIDADRQSPRTGRNRQKNKSIAEIVARMGESRLLCFVSHRPCLIFHLCDRGVRGVQTLSVTLSSHYTVLANRWPNFEYIIT